MVSENRDKKPKILLIIGGILIVIIILVVLFLGVKGIIKIIGTLFIIFLILGILFGVAYLFWYIFLKKHRYDITYVNKQKLVQAGKLLGKINPMGSLYLSGDTGHSRIQVGKIIGYCRIQVLTRTNKYDKNQKIMMIKDENGKQKPDYEIGKEEQDVFTIKKGMGEPMVVRVSPKDHDELIGDVTLKGFSLYPHSEYWFLNSDYLDVRKIDFAILKEAERGIMFENLRDMKEVVDRAIGLDARHKKGIEEKHLVELPEGATTR